jgi:hypothetical protein
VSDETPRPSALRRFGRLIGIVGGGAALCGVLAVAVFPTSTYLDQRSDTTAEEIERLAREQYNLVFPGEEAYAVLPAPLPELDLPALWPFGEMLQPTTAQ